MFKIDELIKYLDLQKRIAFICISINYMLKQNYSCPTMQCILFINNLVFQLYFGIWHLVLLLCDWVR